MCVQSLATFEDFFAAFLKSKLHLIGLFETYHFKFPSDFYHI